MKTLNNIIIVTTTIIMVAIMALLASFTASANVYEDRLKQAFDNIINAVPLEDLSQMHTAYTDPETGIKEGQLDVYKFTIGSENMGLINNAKRVYEQVNGSSSADIYTLWWNDNDGGTFQGYRLYYSPENAITVGIGCDHCYTVGFLTPDDKQHRTTYTIEWDDATSGDSIDGRIAMEKAQGSLEKAQGALSGLSDGQGHSYSFSSSSKTDAKSWMQKLLFYVEKLQDNGSAHYLYLSKLYELCKDTEGLDQTDLKIGMQQLASIYKKLKAKNELKENELQFLESMGDLLQSKIKK